MGTSAVPPHAAIVRGKRPRQAFQSQVLNTAPENSMIAHSSPLAREIEAARLRRARGRGALTTGARSRRGYDGRAFAALTTGARSRRA
jgi:hypothetical protein